MPDVITIGKHLIAIDQIAFVEPFDPSRNPNFKPSKEFKSRLVLLNRDIVLTEEEPRAFAQARGLRFLDEDNVGINPAIPFRVETFEPTSDFKPEKPFQARLKWRDASGKEQSKLLLTKPEALIEIIRGKTNSPATRKEPSRRASPHRHLRRGRAKPESAHP